eukprot:gene37565-45625_t
MGLLVVLVVSLLAMSHAFMLHTRTVRGLSSSLNVLNKAGGEVYGKGDLVGMLAKSTGLTKDAAESFLEAYEKILINDVLGKKAEIRLKGFGTWKTSTRKERMARNPQTGQKVLVPEKSKLAFSVSKIIGAKDEKPEKKTTKAPTQGKK